MNIKKLLLVFMVILLLPLNILKAESKEITLHLFYGDGCPHCEKEMKFLNEYVKDNPNVKVVKYEIWYNKINAKKYSEAKKVLNEKGSGIPFLIIGENTFIGYSEALSPKKIKQTIEFYIENDYNDVVGKKLEELYGEKETEEVNKPKNNDEEKDTEIFEFPIIGEVNAKNISLPILAILIGSIDGFNPCAMWVLIFLITMLFGMKDRKKMWILGLAFLITSAFIYAAFMLTWLNLAIFMGSLLYVRITIGIIAIIFGITNIVNFATVKEEDGCKVVSSNKRTKIMNYIKKITSEKKFILSLIGIIILAGMVNVIELLCSLGLPVAFTQVLSLNNLSPLEYGINIFIYILFFLIDDIIIFAIAMKTLKITSFTSKYTRYSHLIGGIIMVIIGLLMIFKMNWLMFNF